MFRSDLLRCCLPPRLLSADEPVVLKPGPGLDVVQALVRHLPYAGLYQDELGVPDAGCVEGRGDQDAHRLRRADRRRHREHHHQVSDDELWGAAEVVTLGSHFELFSRHPESIGQERGATEDFGL